MSQPFRITFLVGALVQGGAERQLFYMLRSLSQTNAELQILCTTHGEYWEESIRDLGLSITWLGKNRTRPGRLARIVGLLKDDPPDVIQSSHAFTNLYTALSARCVGARGIGAVRASVSSGYDAIGRVAGYFSLRLPHVLAINSEAAMEDARRSGIPERKLFYMPNVVDVDRYRPHIRRVDGGMLVVAVGRLVAQKRFERFVDLIARVRDRTDGHVRGALIGEGPMFDALKRQARQRGLGSEALEFRGAVSNMDEVYEEADVLVLTSDDEGTPNVVLEAMAAGLPVVATDVGDVARLVRHESTGYVLDPWHVETASHVLERLAQDDELRRTMGTRGRERILATRSHLTLLDQLSELYSVAVGRQVRLVREKTGPVIAGAGDL